jgi:hypothetical protein
MNFFLEEDKVMITYDDVFREYAIELKSSAIQLIHYCPWCGKKLPENLRDEYFDELNKIGYGNLGLLFNLKELIDIKPNNKQLRKQIDVLDLEKNYSIATLPIEFTPDELKKFKTNKWWKAGK